MTKLSNRRVIKQWGVCDNCLAILSIEVHPDHPLQSLPPEDEWDSFGLRCPVCGNTVTVEESVEKGTA
jgi:hypothetical protein